MDDRSATIAKITRPLLTGNFPRRRLFRRIDLVMKRSSLWVCGPAGCGKTTLVSSYLADRGFPYIWIRLEESDADPASFFHYLGLAARKAAPRARKPPPRLTPDQRPALAFFSRGFFEALFSRLRAGSVVVFDDYQQVPTDTALHTLIRDGLSMLPPGVRFILIGRGQPPPVFARARAGGSLEILGWKELRLTPGETEGIARLRRKGRRDRAGARLLQRMSDGWAAGLVLLLEKAGSAGAMPRKSPRRAPQEIFDYFAREIFDSLGEAARSFLLQTAHLPRMTADMATKLTGVRHAHNILGYLNRGNYFTEVRPDDVPVYEYHPLFREFLKSRAAEAYPAKRLRHLRGKAAAILEESGHPDEAAEMFRAIGDWRGLALAVRRQAGGLVAQGRLRALGEWLEAMPREVVRKDPWLLYWRGVAGLPTRPVESRLDFERAFRKFSARKDREGTLRAWAGAVDAIVYGSGTLKDLDPWFAALENPWSRGRPRLAGEVDSRVTSAMIKALSLRRPSFVEMEPWADRAMRLARAAGDVSTQFASLLSVAYYRFHGGDFPSTALLIDTLREMTRGPELSPLLRLNLFWLEAAYANASGRHDDALRMVAEGMELANVTGVHLMDKLLAGHGALACLHERDMAAARRFLRGMAAAQATARPWEAAFYHHLAAWLSLHDGETAQAAVHSDRCLLLCEEVGNPWTEALAHLQKFFVLLEEGRAPAAVRHLARARKTGKQSGMRFVRFACLLAEAYGRLREGDEADALLPLREGLRVGRENGYFDAYLWRPGVLEKAAAKALELGIETGYVRELVRRNALVPEDVIADPAHWPWPLKVYSLGGFSVLKGDKPLTFSRKVQRKPLMMLKALLGLGGKDVPLEELTDILWPDAEGDLAHQSFATTLARLRTVLGNEKALALRGGRLTLEPRFCFVDAFAFESLVAQVDQVRLAGGADVQRTQAARLARRAIALYRGPFLPGESSHSCFATARERFRSKFLRAVAFLGREMEREGRWAEAIACYRQGLEVDDLAEEFYQRLMSSLARAGQSAEAMSVYRRCERRLSEALGIAPSADTAGIAKGLPRA